MQPLLPMASSIRITNIGTVVPVHLVLVIIFIRQKLQRHIGVRNMFELFMRLDSDSPWLCLQISKQNVKLFRLPGQEGPQWSRSELADEPFSLTRNRFIYRYAYTSVLNLCIIRAYSSVNEWVMLSVISSGRFSGSTTS